MSIRYKLLLFFLIQHAFFLFITLLLSEYLIRPYNLEIEQKNAYEKISQVKNVFHSEIEHLKLLNIDWAVWDDTYTYMKNRNEGFIKSNLTDIILETTLLNRIEIFDTSGESVYIKDDGKIDFSSLFHQGKLKKTFFAWSKNRGINDGLHGIMKFKDTFALISTHPILNGSGQGPSQGTLLMVRAINSQMMKTINKNTNTNIKLVSIDNPLSTDFSKDSTFIVNEKNHDLLDVTAYLNDLESKQLVMIQIQLVREFFIESEKLIFYLLVFGGILGLVSFFISLYLLRSEVLTPLTQLIDHIVKMRKEDNFVQSDLGRREDEIGILSKEFNNLISKVDEANKTLARVARVDALTGLANRMDLKEHFEREKNQSYRDKLEMSILMFDIDYFKKYNDTYGHVKGDEALRKVAMAIQSSGLRPRDYAARYGGEEFILILPKTHENASVTVAKRILKMIEDLNIEHKSSLLPKKIVSVSIGCLTLVVEKEDSQDSIISLVDEALYTAKEQGRDRYFVYQRGKA